MIWHLLGKDIRREAAGAGIRDKGIKGLNFLELPSHRNAGNDRGLGHLTLLRSIVRAKMRPIQTGLPLLEGLLIRGGQQQANRTVKQRIFFPPYFTRRKPLLGHEALRLQEPDDQVIETRWILDTAGVAGSRKNLVDSTRD